MIRKILSAMLVFALAMGLAGCAAYKTEEKTQKEQTEESPLPDENTEAGEQSKEEPSEEKQPAEEPPAEPAEDPAEVMLASMSLREKIGQLFMITPESLCFDPETGAAAEQSPASVNEQMKKTYAEYPCGGFCLFNANIESPDRIRALNAQLHSLNETLPPVISVDEEGGKVSRISGRSALGIEKLPAMSEIAKTGEQQNAFDIGVQIGTFLSDFGFDLDFAPIADVNTNPSNPIIGSRAFGSDPVLAAAMVSQEVDGLQSVGISSCLKHFPGHGDTKTDTHSGYAETKKTWDELLECEMLPFMAGIDAGAEFIMVAHISAPNITGDKTPSSMSRTIVTEKLRNELGYEGIIITDALNMGAISKAYAPAEAAVTALEAGCDMLLMPQSYAEAFEGVMQAVESGRIRAERLDESVLRILRYKMTAR